jgi:sulfite exporter TauE/SafE
LDIYLLLVPFIAGFSGFFHCLGMCGPFVAGYSTAQSCHSPFKLHLGYNIGRLLAYSFLGGLFGFLGKLIDFSAGFAKIHGAAAILGGSIMIIYGFNNLGALRWLPFNFSGINLPFHHRIVNKALTQPNFFSTLLLGLATSFLPCHLLLPIEAMAAGSGSPLRGILILFVFGLGTLPGMSIYGLIASKLKKELHQRFATFTSLMMIATGIALIFLRN